MKSIILASASPRRKELLEKLGLEFEVVPSDFEENINSADKPFDLAITLSEGKAQAVALKYKNHIIIAADTFIIFNNKIIGKPKDHLEAIEMLKELNGEQVSAITGFTIIDSSNNKKISKVDETKIYLRKLSEKEIISYVNTGEPLDKAGAFAVQGRGAAMVEKIDGDFFNIVGLPLFELSETLKEFGIYPFQ